MFRGIVGIVLVTSVCASAVRAQSTLVVDSAATCGADCGTCGGTWATAFGEIQDAVNCAPAQGEVEIWVAEGTYGSVSLNSSQNTALRILGGFEGNETSVTERDPNVFRPVISGGWSTRALTIIGNDAVLDGLSIANGHMDGWERGGGAFIEDSNARFIDCVFTRNYSGFVAGAIWVQSGSPQFWNCRFHHNQAQWAGGAVFTWGATGSNYVNCLFVDNVSAEAGALSNSHSTLHFVGCTFANNAATIGKGGGIYDYYGVASFRNCIVRDNWSPVLGTEHIYNHPTRGEQNDATYSNIEGGWPGTGNIDLDPQFVYTAGGNFALAAGSPSRNAGNDADLPADTFDLDGDGDVFEAIPLDLDRVARSQEAAVDMGPLEYDGRPFHVDEVGKNRYLSVVPQSSGVMAIRVTLVRSTLFPGSVGGFWWVKAPTSGRAGLACSPVFRDWSGSPVLHIGGQAIVPDATYRIEAVHLGDSLCDVDGFFSEPIYVDTAGTWGDVTGDALLTPWAAVPDGLMMGADVGAVQDCYSGLPGALDLARCDLAGAVPNGIVDINDTIAVQNAQAGAAYPYSFPAACATSCAFGKCCGTSCNNTTQSACGGTWTQGVMCESDADPCPSGGNCPPFCGE